MASNRNAEFSTIEDSRYTMEKAVTEGRANPVPKNWQRMTHIELVEFFEERGIKMHKKPRKRNA